MEKNKENPAPANFVSLRKELKISGMREK